MATTTTVTESNRVFDEFSPKKMIIQSRGAIRYLFSKWYIILVAGVVLGVAGATYAYFKKSTYAAEITFALDEGATQSATNSNLSGLADEFGFTMTAGGVFSNVTNISELIKSRLLIEKTLRSSVEIDKKSVLFADFFLDSLEYRDKWMKKSPYYRIDFRAQPKDKNELLFTNSILRSIYETLISKNISVGVKGKGTSIFSVSLVSTHELFTKYFLEALMTEVTQYYIESKTLRSKLNLDFLQKRTDSIRGAYNRALYGRAVFVDANVNPARQTGIVSSDKQQTDIQILKASYIELVGALESAKTSLMRDTPLIQYLDTPILPLKKTNPRVKFYFIVFFLIGCFFSTLYLATRKGIKYIPRT
ncbi:MAG: hypothetical protein ABIR18_11570 [Chitinophagaceae bacterium]